MMASNKEARKGIRTKAGADMADKRFQLDENDADLNEDGELSTFERERGAAVQKAIKNDEIIDEDRIGMFHGGMPCGMDDGLMVDPESGNEIPIGSSPENVRDDIEIMISEDEYVLPADVVKWHGLKHIMDMQTEAKLGLMSMFAEGLIQYVDEEQADTIPCPECDGEGCDHCDGKGYHDADEKEPDSESGEDTEVSDEGDTEQEKTPETIETPQGNEIEMAGVETTYNEPILEETDDYLASDYGKESEYNTMKRQKYAFIV